MQRQILLTLKQQWRAPTPSRLAHRDTSTAPHSEHKEPATPAPDAKNTSPTPMHANKNFFSGFLLGTTLAGISTLLYSLFNESASQQHSDKILELDEKLHAKSAECATLQRRNEQLSSQVKGLSQENADIKTKIDELHTQVVRKPS